MLGENAESFQPFTFPQHTPINSLAMLSVANALRPCEARCAGQASFSGRAALVWQPVRQRSCHAGLRNSSKRAQHTSVCVRAELQTGTEEVSPQEEQVFKGMFGEWSIDDNDRVEVARYRGGLTVAAVALGLSTILGLISPDGAIGGRLQDFLAFSGAAGLGVSLWYIHIYVTPLKRFVQGLWAVGVASAAILAVKGDAAVIQQVVANPGTVWGVGPLFAAVTGVAFKEGLCYGKPEAGALFFVTPLLLLGHLTGWVPEDGQKGLLLLFTALFAVFAGRKYTQPLKDDLGDKSVFEFQKLPAAEQERLMAELRQQS